MTEGGTALVRVWDPIVRLIHWLLPVMIAACWATAGDGPETLHQAAGLAAGVLVGLRLLWGVVGPRQARLSGFLRGPRAVLTHLRALRQGRAPRHLGHDPAGGALALALLACIALTALSGWLRSVAGIPQAGALEILHEAAAMATLGLAALHVGAVILASRRQGESLIAAMIDGRKRAE